ncbi:replication initiation protein [Cedecea davisae]|uniref:replication initiation protein n=1 Tax=Cedecea davisae TaxID=158484 RepID=UPI001D0B84C1|nr:replication initiation protein [Cedecea davisae]
MFLEQDIYDVDKYKNQIQKYALSCDDFNDGVYRHRKEKALLKKYIGYNNSSFINGLVFDIDHENGAIAWDLAGLPKPNIVIQNTKNGHAHLLYALKIPVLKTNLARIKPLKLASVVQCGFIERLDADKAYADVLMKNPLNEAEWRTTWTDTEAYDLSYLSEFVPDIIKIKNKKRTQMYGLGRNVNLFEDLRVVAYRCVLKYKKNKVYYDFHNDILSRACILNNHCNPAGPLAYNEVKQISKSVCEWTWKNFTVEMFSEIQSARAKKIMKNFTPEKISMTQSERAKKTRTPRKAKLLINFLEGL